MTPEVLDRNGEPLAVGDRVTFCDAYYYINLTHGAGTVAGIDKWGGVSIDTDAPMTKYNRDGFAEPPSNRWYFCTKYDYGKRVRVAARRIGDRFEHGEINVWVEKDGAK